MRSKPLLAHFRALFRVASERLEERERQAGKVLFPKIFYIRQTHLVCTTIALVILTSNFPAPVRWLLFCLSYPLLELPVWILVGTLDSLRLGAHFALPRWVIASVHLTIPRP